jgi:dinuclear metal center YbgI/SA1388 family protein
VTLSDVQRYIESWAPIDIAWKGDNTGLQLGTAEARIVNILLALDVTLEVAREAAAKKANLIITHHPLLFHPLRAVTPKTRAGEIVMFLLKQRINLYAAHTNLDSVSGGVNSALASVLHLQEVSVLAPLKGVMSKIAVFVPSDYVERVAAAMHEAGGGKFKKYEQCSFRTAGIGTFTGLQSSRPFVGKKDQFEKVEEVKLEMIVSSWNISSVLSAMLNTHPYEEVAYDIIPLSTVNAEFGLGAIGTLSKEMTAKTFLSYVKKQLGASSLRYSGKLSRRIRRVAVCGGAGSDCVNDAVRERADAFVTSDIKYHTFQDAERDILLIDAGHFETEHHVLRPLAQKLATLVKHHKSSSKILITQQRTNPVRYC